jgi:hypothetical protein
MGARTESAAKASLLTIKKENSSGKKLSQSTAGLKEESEKLIDKPLGIRGATEDLDLENNDFKLDDEF